MANLEDILNKLSALEIGINDTDIANLVTSVEASGVSQFNVTLDGDLVTEVTYVENGKTHTITPTRNSEDKVISATLEIS